MRPLVAAPGDVDPVDAYGRLPRVGPGRRRVRLNMIEANGYLFLRYRRR